MNLDDLMDEIRKMLMCKWNQRRKTSKKFDGFILPDIIKDLIEKSREVNLEVEECSEDVAEVTAMGGSGFQFVVNLWQVSGIPCKHALAYITSLSDASIMKYVDLYYTIIIAPCKKGQNGRTKTGTMAVATLTSLQAPQRQ